jgi:serine/threonine-protein kinase RsbW
MAKVFRPTQDLAAHAASHEDATRATGPALAGLRRNRSLFEIEAWMPSEIKAISPLVDQLMRLIEGSRCVAGHEWAVELALREALSNAVIHGNEMDAHKLVHVRCRCERGKEVWLTVKDQGKGFDPAAVPDPVAAERLEEEHGRGIHLMKLAMDKVSFECGGTVVHMWKGLTRDPRAELRTNNPRRARRRRTTCKKEPPVLRRMQMQLSRFCSAPVYVSSVGIFWAPEVF